MATGDNAQLLLSIDATTEILRSEVAKATAALEKFASQSEQDANRVVEAFAKMGEKVKETGIEFAKLGAEILIGASIKSAIENAIEYSETLNKTAQQLGFTTQFLQSFRFAASQSATSSEAADKALGKFSVTLGRAADGNKTAAEAFSKLGVNIADANGNLRPSEAIFNDVADAISKIPDPAQQAAAAVAIFGRGGQSLIPILKAGADGIRAFADEARKAGLILDEGTIDRLEELSNAAKKVKQEISVELARVIGDNADAFKKLGDAAEYAVSKIGNLIDQYKGARFLERGGHYIDELTSSGDTLAKLGTAKGQYDYQVANGADTATIGTARDALLSHNAPENMFDSKQGPSGGPVAPVKDNSADKAAAEAAAEKNRQDQLLATGEARLVALRKEVDSIDAQITAEQAKLATTPEAALAADIAAAQAKTDALVAKEKLDAGNDVGQNPKQTADLVAARNARIAGLKTEGDLSVQVIKDNYAREHAATLASLTAGDAEILLQNRSANAALVKDDTERAALQKQIASDEVDYQIANIDKQIAKSKTLSVEEIAELRKQQADLAAGKSTKLAAIDRANQGPLQDYLDTLPDTAGKADKAFQSAAADGLKSFDDALVGIIDGSESVGDAVKKMADSIIADLARILIEKEVVGPLANFLFGGSGGSGGGIFSSLLGGAGPEVAAPAGFLKFADGGDPPVGVPSLVGERGPEMFTPKVPGTIRPAGTFGGGSQAVAVSVDVNPSPLFVTVVGTAVAQGNAQQADAQRRARRQGIARGRG